jgi:hypothetical protein
LVRNFPADPRSRLHKLEHKPVAAIADLGHAANTRIGSAAEPLAIFVEANFWRTEQIAVSSITHRANDEETRFQKNIVTTFSELEFNPSNRFRLKRSGRIDSYMRVFVLVPFERDLYPGLW